MKFKIACQDHQAGESAVKCLSQGYNRMARVGFEPRPTLIRINASSILISVVIKINIYFTSLAREKFLFFCAVAPY